MKHLLCLLVLQGFLQHVLPKCSCTASEFKLHGKYLLGGLFGYGANVSIIPDWPMALDCTKPSDYRRFQVMRFAVQEINNSTVILPNVSLGYDIFDYCSDVHNFPAILDLISSNGSITVQDHASDVSKVIGIIGPFGSTKTLTVAPFFMSNFMPMVNYGSAASALSDKVKYPSFLRTVYSNKDTVQMIVSILLHFDWRWVAFLTSSNDYGQDGSELFKSEIQKTEICLAYEHKIYLGTSQHHLLEQIDALKVNVIIVYTHKQHADSIVRSAIRYKMRNKVWIASDAWSLDKTLLKLDGIQSIGTIIGVTGTSVFTLSRFNDFFYSSQEQRQCEACRSGYFGQMSCGQACKACSGVNAEGIINVTQYINFFVYSAVYALAHALHNVLQCSSVGCQDNVTVHPSMVLKELKKSNFTLLNRQINFDDNGDPMFTSYSMVFWKSGYEDPVTVGSYEQYPNGQLVVNSTEIDWYTNGTVPVSLCNSDCEKGYIRQQYGDHKCCFTCQICPGGTYVNSTDPYTCTDCEKTEWSDQGTICLERTVEYIPFVDPGAIFIMTLTIFMLALLLAVAILFAHNYNTPVVKSAGGPMCFLVLGSLSVSSTGVFFYFGKPTVVSCVLRVVLYILPYTCCIACFAVRSFQIVGIFKMAVKFPEIYKLWVKHNGQWLFIAVVFVSQISVLTIGYATRVPKPYNDTSSFNDKIILKCENPTVGAQITPMFFLGIMCSLCFIFSYMGKDLPKNYNEAKAITFCLLLLIFTWITFITISLLYNGKYLQILNAMAVLSSLYYFLLWYFLPKCYIIIFQPHKNTQQYFQGLIQSYTQNISK